MFISHRLLVILALLLTINAQPCQQHVQTVQNFDLTTFVSKPWYIHQQAVTSYAPLEQNYCATTKFAMKESATLLGYTVDIIHSAQDVDGYIYENLLCAYETSDDNDNIIMNNGKLNVSPCFLPKYFASPYWIVAYDEDEGYALVSGGQPFIKEGENRGCQTAMNTYRSGLWIYSRSPVRDETLIQKVTDIAVNEGFDVSVLNDVEWDDCDIDIIDDENNDNNNNDAIQNDNNNNDNNDNVEDNEEEEEEEARRNNPIVWAAVNMIDGISAETRKELYKMDFTTIVILPIAARELIPRNENPSTHEDLDTSEIDLGWRRSGNGFHDWTKQHVSSLDLEISDNLVAQVLTADDNFGRYMWFEDIFRKITRSSFLFPIRDVTEHAENNEESTKIINELKVGEVLPKSYYSNFDMQSDESFSRMFFYGMGVVLLEAQDIIVSEDHIYSEYGPFVVDMPLQDLKVRSGFRPYGARVHFNFDQQVTAIYDYANDKLVRPGQQGWDEVKSLAKITMFLLITAREHLVWTHFLLANNVLRASILYLSPSHPVRRLLTVFTYRTNQVTLNAYNGLMPEFSVLHRAVGLEYESMRAVFDTSIPTCNIFEPFNERQFHPELLKLSEQNKFPYISQGKQYYKIVQKFVMEWMDNANNNNNDNDNNSLVQYYNKQAQEFYNELQRQSIGQKYEIPETFNQENLMKLLSQFIFVSTAYHEVVGTVIDYTILPDRAGFRLSEGQTAVDLQSYLLTGQITASTAIRMPALMREFNNFFAIGGAPNWERSVWNNFLDRLQYQSDKVAQDNEQRNVEFKSMDPALFESSVSV